jgi:hypothetical protein
MLENKTKFLAAKSINLCALQHILYSWSEYTNLLFLLSTILRRLLR